MASFLDSLGGIGNFSVSGDLVFHHTVQIMLDGTDVSNIFPAIQMMSIRYEDYISFQADNLELTCPDIGDQLINYPKLRKGNSFKIIIHQWNRDYPGSHTVKDTGTFEIDYIKQQGPPTQITILATSVPISGHLKLTRANKLIQVVTLKDLAQKVADENKLKLIYDVPEFRIIQLGMVAEWNESDLQMLARIAKAHGLCVKVTDNKLIVFDEQTYEAKPPVYSVNFAQFLNNSAAWPIERWELTTQSQDIYSSSVVEISNPNTGQTTEGEFKVPPEVDTSGSGETFKSYEEPALPQSPGSTDSSLFNP